MDPNYCIRRVSRWSWYSRVKSHKRVGMFRNYSSDLRIANFGEL